MSHAIDKYARPDKRGRRNTNCRLDEAAVRFIRASRATNIALAKRFGVSASAISNVRTRRTWGWLLDRDAGPDDDRQKRSRNSVDDREGQLYILARRADDCVHDR